MSDGAERQEPSGPSPCSTLFSEIALIVRALPAKAMQFFLWNLWFQGTIGSFTSQRKGKAGDSEQVLV